MKLIYIAGAIEAETAWARERNIRVAEARALRLIKMGAAVYCPHTQCRFYDGELPWDDWLKRDLEILSRCNAIFMLENWKDSKGAKLEYETATRWGMRVLFSTVEVFNYLDETESNDLTQIPYKDRP